MKIIPLLLVIAGWLYFMSILSKPRRRAKNLRKLGYEFLAGTSNWVVRSLFMKDGAVYLISKNKLENAVPVEVIGLSEISRNARLIALEIRYRVNGEVRAARANGTTNQLLTMMDKLGYGG
ncbi:MAG: hypothetical protein LBK23_08375 [Oscillospiraceae bacterium]|jgi:hypothetical protein|nr:hypothetical protein [Oscillospiraceae bacterium]